MGHLPVSINIAVGRCLYDARISILLKLKCFIHENEKKTSKVTHSIAYQIKACSRKYKGESDLP